MTRIITGSLLIVILVFCSLASADRGLASLYANPGKSTLSLWREGKLQPQPQGWEKVRASLEKALSYDSRNPDLLYETGAAFDAEVAVNPIGDPTARKNRDEALKYYTAALGGYPTWPYAWIACALIKYRLHQVDAGFYQALRRSVELGPWEPSVKYTVAEIGMHHWQALDDDMRTFITGIVRQAVAYRDTSAAMLELLRRYDMLKMVCNDNVADESAGQYCKQYHHP